MSTLEFLELLGTDDGRSDEEKIAELFQEVSPVIQAIVKEALNMIDQIMEDGEMATIMAEIARQQYNAYLEAGFTKDQSFELLMNNKNNIINSLSNI